MSAWLGFSLIALLLWGLWGFFSKIATQHLPPQTVYLLAITGHLAAASFLAGSGGITLPWHPWGVAAALLAGISMAFGLLCFFQALATGPATVVVPLTALYPLVTVVLAWLILAESLALRHLAGIILALAAGWLLSR